MASLSQYQKLPSVVTIKIATRSFPNGKPKYYLCIHVCLETSVDKESSQDQRVKSKLRESAISK